ncbi:MAG: phosphatase PAP2 family protein [Salinivirgaceae bacterium]
MNENIASNDKPIATWNRFVLIQVLIGLLFIKLLAVPQVIKAQSYYSVYHLNKADYIITPASWTFGLVLKYGVSTNDLLTQEEIGALTLDPFFAMDNFAMNKYNPSLDKFGDFIIAIPLVAPLMFSIPAIKNKDWQQVATLNIMYAEVLGLTFGMAELSKVAFHRIRPFMYNTNLTVDERYLLNESGDGEKSFYSMHTAFAFSSAVFFSKVYSDSYGKSARSNLIWAGSLGLATGIGISRVYSGQHFPTDVIAGALVGGLTGFLIPALHRKNQTRTSWIIAPNGIRVTYRI